jgi:hypothetical protein
VGNVTPEELLLARLIEAPEDLRGVVGTGAISELEEVDWEENVESPFNCCCCCCCITN